MGIFRRRPSASAGHSCQCERYLWCSSSFDRRRRSWRERELADSAARIMLSPASAATAQHTGEVNRPRTATELGHDPRHNAVCTNSEEQPNDRKDRSESEFRVAASAPGDPFQESTTKFEDGDEGNDRHEHAESERERTARARNRTESLGGSGLCHREGCDPRHYGGTRCIPC